ncbi:MAG: YfbK domain-containing protein [Lacipirellulaceae bacterium]
MNDDLIDRVLAEAIGGETPPDLSERILRRVEDARASVAPGALSEERVMTRRIDWRQLALAAVLVGVGASAALLTTQSTKDKERPIAKRQVVVDAPAKPAEEREILRRSEFVSQSDLSAEPFQPNAGKPTAPPQTAAEVVVAAGEPLADRVAVDANGNRVNEYVKAASVDPTIAAEMIEARDLRLRELAEGVVAPQVGRQLAPSSGAPGAVGMRPLLRSSSTVWGDVAVGTPYYTFDARSRTASPQGHGPGVSGDQYTRINENPFVRAVGGEAVSTFSVDVDTASYSNVRQMLLKGGTLPPPDAVRIEELVNYFEYDYAGPADDGDEPFAASMEVAPCPWKPEHRLVRIGLKGREVAVDKRPLSNLVFLVDVSGSMNEPNKLPLVVEGLTAMTRELGENDRVAIVVYASTEGLVLDSTPGDKLDAILSALGRLAAGGSTAGGAGVRLAYQVAEDHFIEGGVNRVILCTDGDFNVGTTSTADLERLVERKAKETGVYLSVLGFGRGNLNDAMMEAVSNRGNGYYAYIDNEREARRVLVEQLSGTLVTIAKDVKAQVEFNPARVAAYRLIGYENRMLRTEDFNDDRKDAGDIGAGHTVTALYEVVPAGAEVGVPPADPLKYQPKADATTVAAPPKPSGDATDELLTLKLRWKQPDGDTSTKREFVLTDDGGGSDDASEDFRFAAAVAELGLVLRNSEHKAAATYATVIERASDALGDDEDGRRKELVTIARKARSLAGDRE